MNYASMILKSLNGNFFCHQNVYKTGQNLPLPILSYFALLLDMKQGTVACFILHNAGNHNFKFPKLKFLHLLDYL